jgi:soluble P-type ATPase
VAVARYLLLDVNGTLSARGMLIENVAAPLRELSETMVVHLPIRSAQQMKSGTS